MFLESYVLVIIIKLLYLHEHVFGQRNTNLKTVARFRSNVNNFWSKNWTLTYQKPVA